MEAGLKGISGSVAATSAALPPLVPRVDGTLAQAQFVTLRQQLERNAQASPLLLPVGVQQARVDALQKSGQSLGLSFGEIGKAALFAAGSIGLFTSATQAASFSISQNVAYQDAAAAVETLGVNSVELGGRLRALSVELNNNISTVDLLKASYDVASSGFAKTADAAEILRASALLATGGFTTIGTAADATTSVLNAYGLASTNAARLADGFIQTQNDGKIVVGQYAQEIGRVAPIAAAAGVRIEELNAAVSVATAQGVPVGSTFAGLRQAITAVLKPTSEASEEAGKLGLAFNAQALKAQGLEQFLKNVAEKTGGAADANVKLFGSVEAVAAIQPLLNDNLETYGRFLTNQTGQTGQAASASEKATNTLSGSVKRLQNALSDVATAADKALVPVAKLVNFAADAAKAFPALGEGITSNLTPALGIFASLNQNLDGIIAKLRLLPAVESLKGGIQGGLTGLGQDINFLGQQYNTLLGGQVGVGPKELIEFERELAAIRKKRSDDEAKTRKDARFASQAAERDIIRPANEELRIAQRLFGLEGERLRQAKQALDIEKLQREERKKEREFRGLGGNAAVREGSTAAITAKAELEAAGINIRTEIVKGADELRKAGRAAADSFLGAARTIEGAQRGFATAVAGNQTLASGLATQRARETLEARLQRNLQSGSIDARGLTQFGATVTDFGGNRPFVETNKLTLDQLVKIDAATSQIVEAENGIADAKQAIRDLNETMVTVNQALQAAADRESNLNIVVPVGATREVYLP
jgi:TP901 family phage tail tape measure protein